MYKKILIILLTFVNTSAHDKAGIAIIMHELDFLFNPKKQVYKIEDKEKLSYKQDHLSACYFKNNHTFVAHKVKILSEKGNHIECCEIRIFNNPEMIFNYLATQHAKQNPYAIDA